MPPIDPRLPPSTVRTPVATRPEPVPLASPAPAAAPSASGLSSFDRPAPQPVNTRGGVRDPSVGVRDSSVGLRDSSVGLRDSSVGLRDSSVGLRDSSVGLRDSSVGLRDSSVGQLGPERTAYEKAVKSTLEKYLETPSYLRDDAPRGVRSDPKAAVAALPADVRAVLQPAVSKPDSKSAKVVENVVGSSLWKGLSAPEKGNLAKVMSSASEKGLVAFGALLEGTPESVKSTDRNGKSLLANLSELASQPLNAALYSGTTKQKVLDEVLLQTANPDRIEQGNAPTCTVTSMEFELVRDDTAEYVRLMAGLTGPSGTVEMKGGGELKLDPDSLAQLDKRQSTQAIFQSAAMEFGNGADNFDAAKGVSHDDKGVKDDYPGLLPYQQTVMLRQLFGVKYETKSLPTEGSRQKALDELRSYATVGANRPVLLEIDQGNFNHAVTYEMQKNDRVYFRDPYGQVRSMPEEAFIKHVVAVHKPQVMPG